MFASSCCFPRSGFIHAEECFQQLFRDVAFGVAFVDLESGELLKSDGCP